MPILSNIFLNINISNPSAMIPLVISSGFLDGIHPCAIAILIFFIAFLLTLQRTFKNIFLLGLIFIFVIFLTYFGVGVGLLSGIVFFGIPHFFAKLGSIFLIFLGLIQIKDAFFPQLPIHLKMPKFSSPKIKYWLTKATVPGIVIAAFLVGLCAIPCTGGIYAAITALLASKTTYFRGILYLLLYNFMYVMPLIILLFLAANPLTLAKLAEWRLRNEKSEKLFLGILTIVLGSSILIFFV